MKIIVIINFFRNCAALVSTYSKIRWIKIALNLFSILEVVTFALGTKCRPGLRQNRRRLFSAEGRKPVEQRYVTPKSQRQKSSKLLQGSCISYHKYRGTNKGKAIIGIKQRGVYHRISNILAYTKSATEYRSMLWRGTRVRLGSLYYVPGRCKLN